ncbi:BspA family leucine-rich repeat surface protein [Lactobacillus mellis]|uniref:BspA family leucine-rich repeat surface protein n=1 Tax=Bombilactobacillus mellis TaxID=1218508 RepID=UPI0015812C77|nr:BspA family leucine-rich repeat surface protein [Bombilactobacillus mellis]NUG39026.1 BspA family leucine-rich repeat surface protein [Bombilactobacillus mellis]
MQSRNKHRSLVLSSTFVGLVCGLVLTHQQAYAAQTPPVSNQQSQITTVSDNNLNQAAAVNPKSYSSNISHPTPINYNVTPNTYNSPETGLAVKQPIASSDSTTAVATPNTGAAVPVVNETATSTNSGNNNSTNPATSSPTPDSSNSAATPTTGADNPANGNSANTPISSEQPETNIIDQGTWGTSKWDYTQEGADYILHLHAGTLGTPERDEGIGSLNTAFGQQLTQIVIDPGVIANLNSRGLFSHLRNLKTIKGLENLDTSQVTDMSSMFYDCWDLTTLDLSHFDTSQVTNMDIMFELCNNLTTLDVSHFDTSQVTNMSGIFAECQNLTNLDVSHFDTSQVTNMAAMFDSCESLTSLDVSHWDTSQVTDMSSMFEECERLTNLDVSSWDTSQVTDMSRMFLFCEKLTNLDVSHFDTSRVTNMYWMFAECQSLASLDVSHFNTSQVTDMHGMFYECKSLTSLDVSHFDTSQVTDISGMFNKCKSLTSLDVNHFDTSQVTNMAGMFDSCENLTSLDVSHWDTSQVTDMAWMFGGCSSLTSLDLSHFDTSQVTDMHEMFADCKNLISLDLSSFDTSQLVNSVGYYFAMLAGCTNLHHLVLGPKIQLIDQNGWISDLPAVPAAGTKIPGTDKVVTAPYWVATSGYQQGQRYTVEELQQITGRDQVTTYDWDSQPLFASTVNSKVLTRTINVHNPDGTTHSEKQTVMLSQEIKNNADGTQTVGPWSTAQWAAYAIPEIAGYTANPSTVAAQTVNEKTQEQTVDVYYEPVLQQITVNYLDNGKIVGTQILSGYAGETIIPQYRAPKGYEILDQPQGQVSFTTAQQQIIQVAVQAQILKTSETKSLIRTVNIHRPSGTIQTYRQPVVLVRTVYVNAVNGAKSYGSWSVGSWDAVPVPVITGYTASQAQVAAQQVTAQDSDQLLDIYYTKA